MPWTASLSLETAVDGDSVGTVTGSFTNGTLFVVPFTYSVRTRIKPPFDAVKKAFTDALAAEAQRRQVGLKMAAEIQTALNQ